ncbi:DUF1302 family protein [Pseudomonas panipatensis]|uniref:LysR family transcriptional regulator n=1 Tax=Pseudomonas panipatensis TaxID=428992 RepID=A0A1G8I383_9PSED|nr:DUF1302 family protein [Pseudomonas panipatensis]SDI13388.1 hypothetical protein SAMN05216272_1065 [Pseudomonas panipatensis]SMP76214.1 hypothetical protein SAMN06295951_114107 [Pseudomonas panipatensis]
MNPYKNQCTHSHHSLHPLVLAMLLAPLAAPALADDSLKVDGYLREELSWNAKNWQDTPGYSDEGKLSMARSTARLNLDWQAAENVSVVTKLRATREVKTDFLKHLEDMGANNYHSGDRGDIMDLYDKQEIRELYVDFPLGERTRFRIGKQQIAWGETDFFAANDLVHGFDDTWRSFLEPANEELRKTNNIVKMNVDVPEANGGIEVFVRPGLDSKKDIGTEIDVYGGRWSSQPYAGVDFRNIDPYNFENHAGDYRHWTGGLRWSGMLGDTNYSLSYLRTFYNSPILNASNNLALFGMPNVPSGAQTVGTDQTKGLAGEIIYPIVNIYGFTASRYSDWADAVFSTEAAYIKDAPYQIELPVPTLLSQNIAPGFDGYKTKDVAALMLRMDKNIAATQTLLGTEKPMFFSVQLFDKWVQNYDKNDELLYSVGWGGKVKEHSVLATTIFDLSYDNGRVHPQLVLGSDLTNQGGFAVPSVTYEFSSKWRWKVEYDAFWDNGWRNSEKCTPGKAANCDSTTLFGYFHDRDQVYTSLTYLF